MTFRKRLMAALVLVLASAALSPLAWGHAEVFTAARVLSVGPYTVLLEPAPDPIYAGTNETLRVLVSNAATGAPATASDITVRITQDGVPASNVSLDPGPNARAPWTARTTFLGRGVYDLDVNITDDQGSFNASIPLEVFPDLPFRVLPDASQSDPFVGIPYTFRVHIADPDTGARTDAIDDLTVRVEHWTDNHSMFLGGQDYSFRHTDDGLWELPITFEERGMYHLSFASTSGSFDYTDVPLYHMYASSPLQVTTRSGGLLLLSATVSVASGLLSLLMLSFAIRVFARTWEPSMAFLVGAFALFAFKSFVVSYSLMTNAIAHDALELFDAVGDLGTVLLLVTPVLFVRRRPGPVTD